MTPTTAHSRKTWAIALFAGILLAMRIGIARSGIAASLDGQLRPALLSFALLLAPLWFFGFGLGEWLAQRLRSPWSRVAFPALLGVPYLVFAFPAGTLRWSVAIVVFLLPVVLSATLESSASTRNLVWQDGLVLGTLAAVYLFRLFTPAWPSAGLGPQGLLLFAAVLFGLSHFNKGASFNWRYLVLATIAGIFYGRAWRVRRQVLASSITHTAVDVVWSLWFK